MKKTKISKMFTKWILSTMEHFRLERCRRKSYNIMVLLYYDCFFYSFLVISVAQLWYWGGISSIRYSITNIDICIRFLLIKMLWPALIQSIKIKKTDICYLVVEMLVFVSLFSSHLCCYFCEGICSSDCNGWNTQCSD